MEINKEVLLPIVAKNVNAPGLVADLLDGVVEEALKKFVVDTANPYDDMLVAAAYPVIESEIKRIVAEKWAALVAPQA